MMVEWTRKDPMNKYVSRTLFKKAKQYLLQALSEPLLHMLVNEHLCSPIVRQSMQTVLSPLKLSLIGLKLF